ncbi:MAG: hypothetical protein ACREEK_16380 [Bradyrhizobium sp.]
MYRAFFSLPVGGLRFANRYALEATALAGKQSIRTKTVLRLLAAD